MSNPVGGNLIYAGFRGTDESNPAAGPEYARESLNVEFVDGKMRRRAGRSKLIDTNLLRPTKVVHYNGSTATDLTRASTDGDTSTESIPAPFNAAGAKLFVGFPFRVAGIRFYLSSAAPSNTTLAVAVFDRGSGAGTGAFTAITVTDGTASGGFTMKQSGIVNWAASVVNGTWTPGGVTGTAAIDALLTKSLYWIQFSTVASTGGGGIAELQGTLQGTDAYSIRTGSLGMTEFVTRTGDSFIVTSGLYPDPYNNDAVTGARFDYRVVAYDLRRNDGIPVNVPLETSASISAPTPVSYAPFNGWLIGSTPSGRLWRWNGTEAGPLEIMLGMDAQRGTLGALAYLPQGPRGTMLEVYRNRLMVTGNPGSPLTFYASMEDNNITIIPPEASVGGPNVWPLRYVFNVPSASGDKIMGARVISDRYVILTKTSIWAFDDVSLMSANSEIGCVATHSIQKVNNRLFFLSENGVAVTNGTDASIISDPISKTLGLINARAAHVSVSAHDATKSEYWLWIPINGEYFNSVAVVYNYRTESWRTVSGWYYWDTSARRAANSVIQNITAACAAGASDAAKRVLTIDASGILWQEGVGLDDDGKIYPAYALLRDAHQMGDFLDLRNWYLSAIPDGQWFEFFTVSNGEGVRQEFDRRLSNQANVAPIVNKQLLLSNCIEAFTQNTFTVGSAWSDARHTPRGGILKASFGRASARTTPVFVWVPGQYSAGSYVNQVAARGEIRSLTIKAAEPRAR